MTDFAQIVSIRNRRLDRSRRQASGAKRVHAEAGARLLAAQQAADGFIEESRALEIELLTALLNTPVTTHDLLGVEEALRKAEMRAQELAGEVAKARRELNAASAMAEAAAAERLRAELRLNKSREVHALLRQNERHRRLAEEEAELDEFGSLARTGGMAR